jgi:hypothetical protein
MKIWLLYVLGFLTLAGITAVSMYLGFKDVETMTPLERWLNDGGMKWIVIGLAVVVAAVVAFVVHTRNQQAHQAWTQFATRHGLTYEGSPWGADNRIEGRYGDRDVTVRSSTHSSMRQFGEQRSTTTTTYNITVSSSAIPPGVTFTGAFADDALSRFGRGMFEAMTETMGMPRIERFRSGDEAFDADVEAHAEDAEALRDWLTPQRRDAIRELITGESGYSIYGGTLRHSTSDRFRDEGAMTAILLRLLTCADALEPPE